MKNAVRDFREAAEALDFSLMRKKLGCEGATRLRPARHNFAAAALVGAGVLLAWLPWRGVPSAQAYKIASGVSPGCHETITTDALRAARLQRPDAAPLPADRNERALIGDLEFSVPSDLADLGGATLLIGVRDNDLKGRDSADVSQLALVHGDPAAQREHCLRTLTDKEPDGSQNAVSSCRAFILERTAQALDGLDVAGMPDVTKRTTIPLYLSLRHAVNPALPTYYLRIGQAIHAIEDSFTHTYRTPDGMQITTVLNWVNEADGNLVEAMDGPPHVSELDRCDDPDDLRLGKRQLATAAATEMLLATLAPNQTNDQKMAAVGVIMDKYLSYSPGCNFANGWCAAPEHAYTNGSALGCEVAGPPSRGRGIAAALLLAMFALFATFTRRRARAGGASVALLAVFFVSLAAAPARGETAKTPVVETHTAVVPVEPGPPDPAQRAFGVFLGGSGSINHQAFSGSVGGRLRLTKIVMLGLDAEWNPWIAVNGMTTVRAGAFNGYGSLILRAPLYYEKFNLRVTFSAGVSRLLIDLYGAPKGSTGIFVAFSPLGLEWKAASTFYVILNPLGIAVPVPQLKGVPFSYPQYRATLGVEFYGG